uniref:Rootletin-like coiled-coil domain-containing protein n=1 Tax=Ornithorhynchus anatinus TaxID=9258 RepID=A0A6I8N6W3_ORNAN
MEQEVGAAEGSSRSGAPRPAPALAADGRAYSGGLTGTVSRLPSPRESPGASPQKWGDPPGPWGSRPGGVRAPTGKGGRNKTDRWAGGYPALTVARARERGPWVPGPGRGAPLRPGPPPSDPQFFEGYLKGERGRLLGLWREVVTFRRHFLEMKTATDRDLSVLRAEQVRLSGSLLASCRGLTAGARARRPTGEERPAQSPPSETGKESPEGPGTETQEDVEKTELRDRASELSALLARAQKRSEEREREAMRPGATVAPGPVSADGARTGLGPLGRGAEGEGVGGGGPPRFPGGSSTPSRERPPRGPAAGPRPTTRSGPRAGWGAVGGPRSGWGASCSASPPPAPETPRCLGAAAQNI